MRVVQHSVRVMLSPCSPSSIHCPALLRGRSPLELCTSAPRPPAARSGLGRWGPSSQQRPSVFGQG
eukprot:5389900-Alexandrium_andersonii.AAC.1